MVLLRTVVLCCGNPLMGDDGVGFYILEKLRSKDLPVELIDAGTGGLGILSFLEHVDRVIIIDALSSGGEIGKIHRFTYKDLPDPASMHFSLHELGLVDVLKIGEKVMSMPDDILIIGVEIERSNQITVGLTPKVNEAVPKVVEMVLDELSIE
ncbi:MAG: hydrogenase maturation protease [Methanocellales archaeon]|nr:hydrogenase maturation protease [Methanocellales archaeon]MDD3291703.1 hydrogenase maturation protease [Methanocellales archaeon]MDD5235053.1 hydrogenase maturation protease [Methanocellales archaeon]MDD5485191.1 hydrogenase maturation protease [Methanocellales archaeon]